MKKIVLFFDRPYIDAHFCFTELAKNFVKHGYAVDLFYIQNNNYTPPVFFTDNIRLLQFPKSFFSKFEFWSKIFYSKEYKYEATIGTPLLGTELAFKLSKFLNIPCFYLADEIFDPNIDWHPVKNYKQHKKKDRLINNNCTATLALGLERYKYQASVNALGSNHKYFILPNSPSGKSNKLTSHYFRDIFQIEDSKPIILFIGNMWWSLAKKVWEETKTYSDRDYHLIFHMRSAGWEEQYNNHNLIKFSHIPVPQYMMEYVVSSADIGLVLYDKEVPKEEKNGLTGGKIGTYLKCNLPIVIGNLPEFINYENDKVGIFWDNSKENIDSAIKRAILNKKKLADNIPAYYEKNLNYENSFGSFINFLKEIK
ncbi:MAG: hypothetical protein NTY07_16155 [Bacteroidia bacterium]|nr:hypothetical protein [Bacteroidia bacterium]